MSTTVSSVTSHFPSAQNGFTTTLSSTIASGATTVPLNSVAGYTNGQTAVFVVDPSDATKKQTFTGVIDTAGVQVTSVVWTAGTNQTHSGGATVVDYATATHISMVTKGILVAHDQTGVHKSGATYASPVFSGTATGTYTLGGTPTIASPTLTTRFDGWTTGLTAPTTVTYNGNRSYSVVINSTDYTDRLSPGMRLKLTRTVTAPTQCTSLNGTTQYYSKSSPAAMTFTDDFTVSAWVKLSSYAVADMQVISRYNGTSGWTFGILASTGQVFLSGFNAGSANRSTVLSYQSIPLNKWVHIGVQLDMSAFTATTTTSYVMIDGVDIPASVSRAGTNPTALIQAGSLEIGSTNGGTLPFPGKIAQAAIFNAKVTQATMQGYISQGLAGTETSLISAYSFNNSINDLNANANNLTANGSAVATNADSPFAQAATAGSLEYGIIMAATFSTNTTLTVQVPEGSAIPTSGGVSALSYATVKAPLSFPTDASKWRITAVVLTAKSLAIGATATWISSGLTLTLPVGAFNLGYIVAIDFSSSVSGARNGHLSLADSTLLPVTNGVYTQELTSRLFAPGSADGIGTMVSRTAVNNTTTSNVFTLYGSIVTATGAETYVVSPSNTYSVLYAECNHL